MKPSKNVFFELRKKIFRKNKIVEELESVLLSMENSKDSEEKKSLSDHIERLKSNLKKENDSLPELINRISLVKKLEKAEDLTKKKKRAKRRRRRKELKEESEFIIKKPKRIKPPTEEELKEKKIVERGALRLEREFFRRQEQKERKKRKKKEKGTHPGEFTKISSDIFSDISQSLSQKKMFQTLRKDLFRTNLNFVPTAYISMILTATLISVIFSVIIFTILLFIEVGGFPNLVLVSNKFERLPQIFWIPIVIPILIFLFMYTYPSLERKALEQKINQELPFATINMSSISSSMVEPTNIFKIIISTEEYPNLRRELVKLMNQINIYGYDLVTALKHSSFSSPSKKLSELYNGLATTITSGGELSDFFDKRSESLLLDYRLEREKYTKTAETFIDIYISVVIAAPMILMLLFMMIQISGLGIALDSSIITLIMVIGITVINFVFIMFLQLKQPNE